MSKNTRYLGLDVYAETITAAIAEGRHKVRSLGQTLLSHVAEVLHQGERVSRLEKAIERAVESVSPEKKAVIGALQALRGVAKLTAVTIMTEVGTFQRFHKPTELMGYTGLVPSEYSSGGKESKGRITRTGNAHLRHVLGETACHTRHKPWLSNRLKQVLPTLPPGVAEIAWKAQERLHRKFTKMTYQRKPPGKVTTAVARELVGFIWAIGYKVEREALAQAAWKEAPQPTPSTMKQGVSDREWHGKENPRRRCAVTNPRCLVRGSSRRMKDCEVANPRISA